MAAMTCLRVTPAFTVRTTITPVVAGELACARATDGCVIEVAPIGVEVSAKATLRIALIGLASPITGATLVVRDSFDVANGGARHQRCSLFASPM